MKMAFLSRLSALPMGALTRMGHRRSRARRISGIRGLCTRVVAAVLIAAPPAALASDDLQPLTGAQKLRDFGSGTRVEIDLRPGVRAHGEHSADGTTHAGGGEYLGGPPLEQVPLEVKIGFSLVNITDVSEKDETIDFKCAIHLSWNDPRLTYDLREVGLEPGDFTPGDYTRAPRRIYQGDFAVKELYEGWRPHIVIPNGVGDRSTTKMTVGVWPDGRVEYGETFYAKVETPMDLRLYPFDRQSLEIFFHPNVYNRSELVLVPDDRLSRTWDQNMGIAEWEREAVLLSERSVEIVHFDDTRYTVSEFVAKIDINRQPLHILISIILPLVVLVCLTWSVFWMDEESISNRINISFIGILSVVAYYFVILDSVPKVAYLTLIDAFMIATFLILAAGVVINIVVDKLNRRGNKLLGDKVDSICRWAFPVSYATVTALLVISFFVFTSGT